MAYTPTMPPFSPQKGVYAVSPMSEIPVPAVPAVPHEPEKTQEPRKDVDKHINTEPGDPSSSFDAERRFGQRHATLFLFIGRKVTTPAGSGTLLQVFAERVTVLLDSELRRCSWFRPAEIQPVSKEVF